MKTKVLALMCALVMFLFVAACASTPAAPAAEPAAPVADADPVEEAAPAEEAAAPVDDTVYKLIFSTTRGENTWFAKAYDDIIAELEEASNGRLVIEVHHNNTLGAPGDIWTMFTTGGIDMLDMSPGMVGSFTVSELLNVPFYFDTNQQVIETMQGLYDAGLLPEYTDTMQVLAFLPGGGVELCTTNKKVESMADLQGLKLRGSSATLAKGIEAMGGTAVSIQPSEQTMALSQGVLDGVITGANFAEITSLYESCNYLLNCNIGMSCMFCGINNASYAELPADLQQLLTETFARWFTETYMPTLESEYTAVLDRLVNQHGMEVYQPSDEFVGEMKAATAPILDDYKQSLTDAGIDTDAVMAIADAAIAN